MGHCLSKGDLSRNAMRFGLLSAWFLCVGVKNGSLVLQYYKGVGGPMNFGGWLFSYLMKGLLQLKFLRLRSDQ